MTRRIQNLEFGKRARIVSGFFLVYLISALCALPALGSGMETESSDHWAFQPLAVFPADSGRTGPEQIDDFVARRLNVLGLKPNGPADKYTLIRRASFDLTGLPPTPDEIRQFVNDSRHDAYSRLIDRLLALPAYGERWGRYWLDLARYADTNGADENMAHPNAWRYREYVIRSFNDDKPYDRFVQEQLAGDLLPSTGDQAADVDQIIATGFLALGPKMLAEQDKDKMLYDVVDEQIDVVTKTFLGMTVSCARCHDHKFDPIPQEDYYALAGVFRSTRTMANTDHVSRWVETVLELPENDAIEMAHDRALVEMAAEIAYLENYPEAEDRDKRLEALKKERKQMKADGPPFPQTMSVTEGQPFDMPVHIRGNHLTQKEEPTVRGVIGLLDECLPSPTISSKGSGRLELAEWLTDVSNPLPARVMANRVWQGHFGFGLVRSPSNFGLRGEEPSHPELLDWLAVEFVENGWSLKKLHRTIMLSETYRRSSAGNSTNAEFDPDNRHLWRQNRRRLEAEPTRDALLFVSGRLVQTSERALENLQRENSYYRSDEDRFEKRTRAVYLPVVRASGYEMFSTFDAADPSAHHQFRNTTTVPSQALFLLNSDLALAAVHDLAVDVAADAEQSTEHRLNELYLRVFGRPARAEEIQLLATQFERDGPASEKWEQICRVLIAANEFIYVN